MDFFFSKRYVTRTIFAQINASLLYLRHTLIVYVLNEKRECFELGQFFNSVSLMLRKIKSFSFPF